jgi:flagellar basal-body rod protein FlgC
VTTRCPRCGDTLSERTRLGVTVDVCERRRGMWLDRREIETLVAEFRARAWARSAEQSPLVRVLGIVESAEPPQCMHRPRHPNADASGYAALPNIPPLLEVIDLLAATRAYEANMTTFRAVRSMGSKALEISR